MARRKALNPEETLFAHGSNVRVERGLDDPADKESGMVWIVYKRTDVKDDPDTTYDYRFDEVARYKETDPGVCPDGALERADSLAQEG